MNYSQQQQQQQHPWKLTYSAVSGQSPSMSKQTVIKFYDRPTIDVRLVMGYSDCFE